LKFERYGTGIAKGMGVTLKNFFRHPITTQYPEQRLVASKRVRGNSLIWDEERCSGCASCAKSCHQGTIHIATSGEGRVTAPCSVACPAHVDIPRYVRFASEGKAAEAVAVIREKAPFPASLGRICIHPCEGKCQRVQMDNALAIKTIKRFVADYDETHIWKRNSIKLPATGKKVAVVGAGPGGLTAGYYLAKKGHRVTIFETLPRAGGMMAVGIPDYRLPENILQAEIDEITAVGVDIKFNTRIESVDKLFADGFDAVFLAVGAHEGMKMGVDGEDSPGVIDCATFLRMVNLGEKVELGDRVAIIGGGNAAVDAARVALRVGAGKVKMIYRRTRAEMPADPEEIEATLHEGIDIVFLGAPSKITAGDGVVKLECIKMELGEPDDSGRRRPVPIKNSEYTETYDTVIASIGQRPQVPEGFGVKIGRGNVIEADDETLATERAGVYTGGDCKTGAASVVEAIAAGRTAAESIDKYLGGDGNIIEKLAPPGDRDVPMTLPTPDDRLELPEIPVAERVANFDECELKLPPETGQCEASRCLMCDLMYDVDKFEVDIGVCIFCGLCVEACPRDALHLDYNFEHGEYQRGALMLDKDGLLINADKQPSAYARAEFEKDLQRQTILLDRQKVKE
jgi:NADPH-dependent glutamate synthase beta subunit-like oxidoreductase/formate hydrogenlyase subunit 6/NADH:ubiquinone oxidoreductase subunit I